MGTTDYNFGPGPLIRSPGSSRSPANGGGALALAERLAKLREKTMANIIRSARGERADLLSPLRDLEASIESFYRIRHRRKWGQQTEPWTTGVHAPSIRSPPPRLPIPHCRPALPRIEFIKPRPAQPMRIAPAGKTGIKGEHPW